LGYHGDLYGTTLRVAFVRFLRPEMRFEVPSQLAEQIAQDIVAAKAALGVEE